jgi:hypothetical protein
VKRGLILGSDQAGEDETWQKSSFQRNIDHPAIPLPIAKRAAYPGENQHTSKTSEKLHRISRLNPERGNE